MTVNLHRVIDFRGGAFVSVVIAVLMGVVAIAAFSWAVDIFAETPADSKTQRMVAIEVHDPIIVLADSDPRSAIPVELLKQLTR